MSEADNFKNRNSIVKVASSEQTKTGSALEDEMRRAFSTPTDWVDSPNVWNMIWFAVNLLLPMNYLKPEIERIGRKYRRSEDWPRFGCRVARLLETYDQLALAKALPERSGMSYPTYQDLVCKVVRREARKARDVRDGEEQPKLSAQKNQAIRDGLIPVLSKLVRGFLSGGMNAMGSAITPLERKRFLKAFPSLGALPPGPVPGPDTQETWRIYRDFKRQGKHGSPAAIARLQYSGYAHADPSTKRDYRDRVKAAIRIMPQQS